MKKSTKNKHIALICLVFTALAVIFFPMLAEKSLVSFKKMPIDNSLFENLLAKNSLRTAQNDINNGETTHRGVRGVPLNPHLKKIQEQPLLPQAWLLLEGNYESETVAASKAQLLQARQLNAFVQQQQRHDNIIYQVVIGPEINRQRINQLKQQLALEAAVIIPYRPV